MKKFMMLIFILVMALSLAACGGGSEGGDGKTLDAEKVIEENVDFDSFSVDAVEYFLKKAVNMELSAIEPDWEYTIKDYGAYADDPSNAYGHAAICFTKPEGELSDEEYDVWRKKVFDATAAASQDGHNIVGWEFAGDGKEATDEVSLEDTSGGWGFRYNDTFMVVYVSMDYDTEKDSATAGRLYYDGVEADIAVGLQKSFDETMEDAEQYLEENEDEVKDALEDYLE